MTHTAQNPVLHHSDPASLSNHDSVISLATLLPLPQHGCSRCMLGSHMHREFQVSRCQSKMAIMNFMAISPVNAPQISGTKPQPKGKERSFSFNLHTPRLECTLTNFDLLPLFPSLNCNSLLYQQKRIQASWPLVEKKNTLSNPLAHSSTCFLTM